MIRPETFDNVIGISCKLKKKRAECKILELVGWEEFPNLGYRDVRGLIPHIAKYGVIAKRTIDSIHIYKSPKIDNISNSLKKGNEHIQVIFEEPMVCGLANEKERGNFFTCPAYPYAKDDKRLKGAKKGDV